MRRSPVFLEKKPEVKKTRDSGPLTAPSFNGCLAKKRNDWLTYRNMVHGFIIYKPA
jgi:hypothetical protein